MTATKAELFRSLHVPGTPVILTNVWDAATARMVAASRTVKALATTSRSVSFAHGVPDGEGLTIDQALSAAESVITAVEIPVSIDFEKGYATDLSNLEANVRRLIAVGAAGLNIEDSKGAPSGELYDLETASQRIAAVRSAAASVEVPIVINARVDTLAGAGDWDEAMARANAYIAAGADVAFVVGLDSEEKVQRAVKEIDGLVSVVASPSGVPLRRLAELGVARVSYSLRSSV